MSLIVITDAAAAAPRSIIDVVARAVAAGAPAIQLRDKGASARELHEVGLRLREVTRAADALLFVNDRYDVALAIGADGVHVGPDDVPVHALRSVVSPDFLIGASTDDPSRAARLERDGASYIGCGAVHPTQSKDDAGEVIGLDGLTRVVEAVALPVVAIGGIDADRARVVREQSGATGVAVISAVMRATDVEGSVRALL